MELKETSQEAMALNQVGLGLDQGIFRGKVVRGSQILDASWRICQILYSIRH